MQIDDKSYQLPIQNYISTETGKSQIVIGNTFNKDMRHYTGWLHRNNGQYKKTAHYTITVDGTIYEHFSPIYYSRYFKNYEQNLKSIVILLENDGWLIRDSEKDQYLTWIGDIYKEPSKIIAKKWRGFNFWTQYTEQQFESAINLTKVLCDRFSIPLTSVGHNTKIDILADYRGILYKSNLEKHFTDPNPSWDCELFKNKIESYERTY